MKNKPKIITISAKCSDLFNADLIGEDGKNVGENYDGYVPTWFPNPSEGHYGDYVSLSIDISTGKIINWKKPTVNDLKETFKIKN